MNNEFFRFEELEEFDNHKLVSFLNHPSSNLKGFIAIHRGGIKNAAFGATRFWNYQLEIEALKDALRLSKLMSYKACLAGLNHGGAKAVIISPPLKSLKRNILLKAYSNYVNLLNGHFITGADVGISDRDLKLMSSVSTFIVGLKSDPVKFTVLGVFYSLQVCLKELFGSETIHGRTFAIQGLGKTGMALLELIYKDAKKIYVTDIDGVKISLAKHKFPHIEVAKVDDIYKQKVDIFCPCALSGVINTKSLSSAQFKAIIGSANNQLESDSVGELLYKMGILYGPDYVVNAGGLISVVDEYENKEVDLQRIEQRVANIKKTLKAIISKSKKQKQATNLIADEMAEKIFNKFS